MSRKKTFSEELESEAVEVNTKTYVFTIGKHTDSEGKKYNKGDRIELTEEQAQGLANKVIDLEASYGVSVDGSAPSIEDCKAMVARIAELEQENRELREATLTDD